MKSYYKYLNSTRLDVLAKRTLRFTQATALNDPFELRPYFDEIIASATLEEELALAKLDLRTAFRKEYRKLPQSHRRQISEAEFIRRVEAHMRANPEAVEESLSETREMAIVAFRSLAAWARDELAGAAGRLIGILSLSEVCDSTLMWAHYAENHRGYVVEFDGLNEFFDRRRTAEDDHYLLRAVRYPTNRPRYRDITKLDLAGVYLTKGREWSYEREYRMTVQLAYHPPFDPAATESIHLLDYPAEAIRGVVLGARAAPQLEADVRLLLSHDPELKHVALGRAVLSQTDGRIVVAPFE